MSEVPRAELIHWHQPDQGPAAPADCCVRHLGEVHERRQDEAVHAERRRVILNALHVVETFGENVTVALQGREKELAEVLTKHAAEAIRKTGCICPRIDTTTLGGKPSWTRGYDARCGMHEPGRRASTASDTSLDAAFESGDGR